MGRIWQTIRGYIWWTRDRGSFHYDIMVTLILAFIFLGPLWINFKDKPTERNPHPTRVVVLPDEKGGFIYQIDAAAVQATDDGSIRTDLKSVIEPIAGEVEIARYEPMRDRSGRVTAYRVWVTKP